MDEVRTRHPAISESALWFAIGCAFGRPCARYEFDRPSD
jgi:hypothetical protein